MRRANCLYPLWPYATAMWVRQPDDDPGESPFHRLEDHSGVNCLVISVTSYFCDEFLNVETTATSVAALGCSSTLRLAVHPAARSNVTEVAFSTREVVPLAAAGHPVSYRHPACGRDEGDSGPGGCAVIGLLEASVSSCGEPARAIPGGRWPPGP